METNQNTSKKYLSVKKQVQEIKAFYGNLVSYVTVILFLLFINLKYTPDHLWFFWPMLGWGIGLLFHGMKAFNFVPMLGQEWEQKKIKEFMEQEKNNNFK